jgi:hypothetical protein
MKLRCGYSLKAYFVRFSHGAQIEGGGFVNGQQIYCVSRSFEHSKQLINEHYNQKGVMVQSVGLVSSYIESDAIFALPAIRNHRDRVIGCHRGIVG